tara:strand:+ start:1074 stop:1619 length:546 start_codon:yes stop_codon:yes gene_type:complete
MQNKNRKLSKAELELWKEVTKKDVKYKNYSTSIDENPKMKVNDDIIKSYKPYKKVNEEIIKSNYIDDFQVNKRMKSKLERGNIRPEAILDLHGNNQVEAKNELVNFIDNSIRDGIRCVLVITGKKNTYLGAKGILRRKLPIWLKEKDLANKILLHCYATIKDGADGARYVLLRKKEKVFYD